MKEKTSATQQSSSDNRSHRGDGDVLYRSSLEIARAGVLFNKEGLPVPSQDDGSPSLLKPVQLVSVSV